jgi:hypothetical protein
MYYDQLKLSELSTLATTSVHLLFFDTTHHLASIKQGNVIYIPNEFLTSDVRVLLPAGVTLSRFQLRDRGIVKFWEQTLKTATNILVRSALR